MATSAEKPLPSHPILQGSTELLLLVLVALAPWAFGAVVPVFEFVLYCGIAGLLVLWAVQLLLDGRLTLSHCPVALVLAAIFLGTALQLVPLPRPLLGVLSPNALHLADELLPSQPEILRGDTGSPVPSPEVNRPLSLHPADTRAFLVRVLALILIYLVVRNRLASPASFRRLAWLALVNGALLALLAIAQFISSPKNVVYWTVPTPGTVFGPFVCRNHYPDYLNLCIGLAAGLLAIPRRSARLRSAGPAVVLQDLAAQSLAMLQQPRNLWIAGALALMVGSIPLSLSRGGLLALLGSSLVCLVLWWRAAGRPRLPGLVLGAVPGALLLVAWLGWTLVEARLTTLWKTEELQVGRWSLWTELLPLVPRFLVGGTGGGTLSIVETLYRRDPRTVGVAYEYAHNDYLESLIEGGVFRLGLSLLLVVFLLRGGVRALRRWHGRSTSGLVLGALFGVTAVALHSFVDFGLHIPAVALLTVVVAAQLMAAADAPDAELASGPPWGRGPVTVAAALLTVLAVALVLQGWTADRADRYRAAAHREQHRTGPGGPARSIPYWEAAVSYRPDDARLHQSLGQAHLDAYQEDQRRIARRQTAIAAAEWVTWAVDLRSGTPGEGLAVERILGLGALAAVQTERAEEAEARAVEQHLRPGLHQMLLARNLCPLLGTPHARLAAYRHAFTRADPASRYLERARSLVPFDPDIWYASGLQFLLDDQPDQAWAAWQRCLHLSDQHLNVIVDRASRQLNGPELLDRVLPDRPETLLAAAERLDAPAESSGKPLLERALSLVQQRPAPLAANDLHLMALLHQRLNQPEEALAAYQAALQREPFNIGWRLENAQLLRQQGKLVEARRELIDILRQDPGHAQARQLVPVVTRELELQNGLR